MGEPVLVKKNLTEKIMNKKNQVLIIAIFCVITLFLGTSYALLTNFDKTDNVITIKSGNLTMTVANDLITLSNKLPESDTDGLTNATPVIITLTNTGTMDIMKYDVKLVKEDSATNVSTLEEQYVKYAISTDGGTTYSSANILTTNDNIIFTGYNLAVDESTTIYLKIWIDENAKNNAIGKSYYGSIKIDLYQHADVFQSQKLDKSGANEPELLDNMIPVYYDKTSDTAGVWRKADSNNEEKQYKWYDYKDFMWANAVTVKESGTTSRTDYLNAPLGTEVSMDDITTMWVWIPRYKYTIWSGNNETSQEQLINVEFEIGTNKTGTVTCVDNILTSSTSSSSETCTDATNGSIVNGTSTYTHPAFTFGDTELTGFWYAKFEMSTDQDSTCVTSQSETNCNITGQNIYVKPDQISLRYINIANSFVNIRNMELFNNVHGFTQDTNATTSSSQTGEIVNDTNDYDIHMQKNMEWGAVTYLAYSEYGKYGNSLYTGTYKRVYKNNWYTKANRVYTYKTGYSGYSYNANYSTSNTVLYNDLTDLESSKGYKGAGASTTGTIYGIYDMNGGAYDRTMGNMVNSSGNFYSLNSGFTTSPLEKYYDKYSYNSNSDSSQDSVSRGKLGDATKEMTKGFTGSRGSWEGSYRIMPIYDYPWFYRGGISNLSAYFGLSNSSNYHGDVFSNNSSRPVLVYLRDTLQ